MRRLLASHGQSIITTSALVVLGLLLLVLQPHWDTVLRWQTDGRFKKVTGYVLLTAMACMWLPVWLRERFREAWQLEVIKVAHQWLGAVVLLALLLHANLARSGYLAVFTAGLLVACGSGTVLSLMQQRGWLPGRRWLMAAHITLAGLVSGFALLHLYFVYAYAG